MAEALKLKHDVEFVSRQLSYLGKQSDFDLEESLAVIEQRSEGTLTAATSHIRKVLGGTDNLKGSGLAVLATILNLSKPAPEKVGDIIHQFSAINERIVKDTRLYLFSLRNTFAYISILFIFVLVLFTINMTKVLPNFIDIYAEQGANLPKFTSFIVGQGKYMVGLLLFLIALIITFTFHWFNRIRSQYPGNESCPDEVPVDLDSA